MKKFMKICSILVLLTGSVFAAFSFWPSSDDSLDVRVEFVNRVVNKDGEFVVRRSTRIQKGNGDWQEKSQYFKRDGTSLSEVTTLGIGGQGVISIKPATQELIYLGERPSGYRPSFNPSEAKKIVGYEREDVVAGQKVLVFSGKDGPTIFLAADLNGMMLKTVEGDDVVEAVVVE